MTVWRPALLTTDTNVCYLSDAVIQGFFFYFGLAVFYLVLFVSCTFFLFLGCFCFFLRFFLFLVLFVCNPLSEVAGSKAQGPSSSFAKELDLHVCMM